MEISELELVSRGEKRDVKGRCIQSADERQRILSEFDRSGLSQRAFAEREGIRLNTFLWWLKQRRDRTGKEKPVKFEAFELPQRGAGDLEVVLKDGTRMRGSSAEGLAILIKALKG